MPFRSEKQRRYLWKHEPKIAREWTDEYGSKPQPKKKKKGGRIKKNGPVRPIHIPWDSQKKKRGGTVHPRNQGVAVPKKGLGSLIPRLAEKVYGNKKAGGLARRPKRDKHNPHMEPYHGSYISGKVDGKMLSNPSLRKYYKGHI